MSDTGQLPAALEKIRADITDYSRDVQVTHAPSLLAAVDAVLELADGWTAEALRLDRLADQAAGEDGTAVAIRRTALGHRAQVHDDFARELREVITRELVKNGREEGNSDA